MKITVKGKRGATNRSSPSTANRELRQIITTVAKKILVANVIGKSVAGGGGNFNSQKLPRKRVKKIGGPFGKLVN